jgi:hypothetical protein
MTPMTERSRQHITHVTHTHTHSLGHTHSHTNTRNLCISICIDNKLKTYIFAYTQICLDSFYINILMHASTQMRTLSRPPMPSTLAWLIHATFLKTILVVSLTINTCMHAFLHTCIRNYKTSRRIAGRSRGLSVRLCVSCVDLASSLL